MTVQSFIKFYSKLRL